MYGLQFPSTCLGEPRTLGNSCLISWLSGSQLILRGGELKKELRENCIWLVHCFYINPDKTKYEERIIRDRLWFFFHKFEDAEKAVLDNYTDMYEVGYYNYACIYPCLEGRFAGHINSSAVWYKVDYEVETVPPEYCPKVTKLPNGTDMVNDGLKSCAKIAFGF